ncbi:MAG TPA: PilT/PilU family type 4a pilus ATPase [Candidatus Dormibacteraeota bacterium]|nr:PilT/PilU family type 4a pilus ATPase [Candidatus Dormibacteraeota bacterium]
MDTTRPNIPAAIEAKPAVPTASIIAAILQAAPRTSDVIFSPGRLPQAEVHGKLVQLQIPGVGILGSEDTARIAADLIGRNSYAVEKLKHDGSCDISYSLPRVSRFRVNVFTQRGSCAIVMRVVASTVPDFESLHLPKQLAEAAGLRPGIVLVTGPTGSGKSSTLAAFVDKINKEIACHIVTIEDPIEFLHAHQKATVHQRELHTDTPNFATALRAALRQAPKLILVDEIRDRETMEVALEASETGHLVFSTLHTIDASKTIERIVGIFPIAEQATIRMRFSRSFRYIISQRLLPRCGGTGRVAVFEILKSTLRAREYVQKGKTAGKSLLDAMRDGSMDGMQCFDDEIEKQIRAGAIDLDTGLTYATNAGNLRLQLADLIEASSGTESPANACAESGVPAEGSQQNSETELEITR